MPKTGYEILDLIAAKAPAGTSLQLPPPCLTGMQAEILEYRAGETMRVRFPVLERYQNPLGFMQGGYIAAALDNTLGPFSYLEAPPNVTSQMTVSYLRPVPPGTAWIECAARLTERTGKTLYLSGEVRNPEGKVVALCHSVCQIL